MHTFPKIRRSTGFTVTELMIVMAILGLLVAVSLSAFNAAVAQSKVSRTKVIIAKLDQLVMDRYESYRTRPIPLRAIAGQNVRTSAQNRLLALREIMRMELPSTKDDVNDNPALVKRTAINRGYQRRAPSGWSDTWEGAECLYLIIASIRDGEKSGLDFFTSDEIGDTDGDGVPEILDAWGTPIQFIRWAPGYISDHATYPCLTMQNKTTPDSFDLLKADSRWSNMSVTDKPYDLKPLIFSYGPDRETTGITIPSFSYAGSMPYGANDPYYAGSMSGAKLPGEIVDSAGATATADNITNHYQEAE